MTAKTAKTILFASLIAAMILPFSMVDYAVAEKQYNISDEIDKLIAKYNSLEVTRQQLKDNLRATESEEIQESIRAEIAEIEEKQDRAEVRATELAQQETEYAPSPSALTRAITTGSQISVNDYHNACDNSTILSASETITGTINTGTDTISWDWDVPDAKSVGWFWPFCNNVHFEEIDFITRNNTKGLSCTMKTDNQEVGNIIQTCNCGVDDGDFLSWSVQTTYEPLTGSDTSGNRDWRGLHRA